MDDYLTKTASCPNTDCAVIHERLAGCVKVIHKELSIVKEEVKDIAGRYARMEELLRLQEVKIDEINRNTKIKKELEEEARAKAVVVSSDQVTKKYLTIGFLLLFLGNLGAGVLTKSPEWAKFFIDLIKTFCY